MKDAGSGMGRRLLNRLCTTNTESDNFWPVRAKVLLRAAGAAMRLHRARVQAGRPFHLCSASSFLPVELNSRKVPRILVGILVKCRLYDRYANIGNLELGSCSRDLAFKTGS